MMMGLKKTVVVVVATMMATSSIVRAEHEVLQVHGSGTTNPSKCYWDLFSQIMTRVKLPTKLTYRAVGSTTGQEEFMAEAERGLTDFGSSDFPLSTADYNTLQSQNIDVVQLPVLIGAVSFFHSVPLPASSEDGLRLTGCLLARIFTTEITNWNHPDIVALNPGLKEALPSGSLPIRVARRVRGSSSTLSTTQYLTTTCPDVWPATPTRVGEVVDWDLARTEKCQGSSGMAKCISAEAGTIGYIDAGHGHSAGLAEVVLQNADQNWLTSKQAKERNGIVAAADQDGVLPVRADMDFGDSAIRLMNRAGTWTWPIVQISYVLVKQDLTTSSSLKPEEQSLFKAFLEMLYDDYFIQACGEDYAFTIPDAAMRQFGLDGIASIIVNTTAPVWSHELTTLPSEGTGDYIISAKRKSTADLQRASNEKKIAAMQVTIDALVEKLEMQMPSGGDGSGATTPQKEELQAASGEPATYTTSDATRLTAALVLSALSFVFWAVWAARYVCRRGSTSAHEKSESVHKTSGGTAVYEGPGNSMAEVSA